MGRRKQAQPTVAPVESTVTPVQTINPEGHTGNAWVPIGSQSTQAPGQPTQAPGQEGSGSAISGTGRFGMAGRTAQQVRNYEFWKKRRNRAVKSRGGSMGAPVAPGATPESLREGSRQIGEATRRMGASNNPGVVPPGQPQGGEVKKLTDSLGPKGWGY